MSGTTSPDRSERRKQRMQKSTSATATPMSGESVGSENMRQISQQPAMRQLPPWEIAVKLLPIENGLPVSIEFATDAQFQDWIVGQGVPVDEGGIADWSFDDRCGVINHVLAHGAGLHFAGENNSETIPENS